MNYIVLDLEWNQAGDGKESEVPGIPFEIIEIGAVKLDNDFTMTDRFERLIKPQVYHEMHLITGKLIHLNMDELKKGMPFRQVASEFLDWCGPEEYRFCTWGSLDLTELQRNMEYYEMKPISEGPIPFLDVQKLFSLAFEDGKSRRALEFAVDQMKLEKEIPFHRAFSDAYYTGKIMQLVGMQHPEVLNRISFDIFKPPASRDKEIKIQFDNYMKYISREFDSKTEAFTDREVVSCKCYLCHRNLRKKIRWFSSNNKNYYCLAWCEKHGYLKGKIRVRKSDAGKVYIVKTTKFVGKEEAEALRQKGIHAKELRRKHNHKTGIMT